MEIENKFLPIGTVVLLKGGKKEIMITSYCIFPNNVQVKDGQYITPEKKIIVKYLSCLFSQLNALALYFCFSSEVSASYFWFLYPSILPSVQYIVIKNNTIHKIHKKKNIPARWSSVAALLDKSNSFSLI